MFARFPVKPTMVAGLLCAAALLTAGRRTPAPADPCSTTPVPANARCFAGRAVAFDGGNNWSSGVASNAGVTFTYNESGTCSDRSGNIRVRSAEAATDIAVEAQLTLGSSLMTSATCSQGWFTVLSLNNPGSMVAFRVRYAQTGNSAMLRCGSDDANVAAPERGEAFTVRLQWAANGACSLWLNGDLKATIASGPEISANSAITAGLGGSLGSNANNTVTYRWLQWQ